jgi:probable phosphoglycerate mutase
VTRRHTELLLIRHGVTEWNKDRRFQGHVDIPLDDEGRSQARRLGDRLAREHRAGPPLAAVYSSDLARASQTADAVAAALGLAVSIDAGLRERFYGAFEGRTAGDLEREYPDAFARWRAREPDFDLPGGGESLRRFHDRVRAMLVALAARHEGERVVAVTHGGVLDVIHRIATGGELAAPRRHELLNASVNRVGWDGESFTLIAWADVGHLSAEDASAALDDSTSARGAGSRSGWK